LTRAVRGG